MPWFDLEPFLLCEDHESANPRTFVLHTQPPRFLVEIVSGGVGEVFPIDSAPDEELNRLAEEACKFVGGERC